MNHLITTHIAPPQLCGSDIVEHVHEQNSHLNASGLQQNTLPLCPAYLPQTGIVPYDEGALFPPYIAELPPINRLIGCGG